MALTYGIDFKGQATGVGATITSNTLPAVTTGDFLTIATTYGDNLNSTAWTVTNTGTAITWTKRAETNTASNDKVVMWSGTAGATPPTTVSVESTAGNNLTSSKTLLVAIHTGAHATNPLPPGNIFLGTGGTDVSRAITPTATGSALWFLPSDWNATNSYAAGANCTLAATVYHEAGSQTTVPVRPATQPRTDANAFTLSETDTSGKIAWVAWEVQAASTTTITGTSATTNSNDTLAATGTTTVTGTLGKTNANDSVAASGTTTVIGTLSATNANDSVAATGTTTATGTLSKTHNNDSVVASGTTTVTGTLATTNANDSVVASGEAGEVTGTAAITNNHDGVVASGVATESEYSTDAINRVSTGADQDEREDERLILAVIKYCVEQRLL